MPSFRGYSASIVNNPVTEEITWRKPVNISNLASSNTGPGPSGPSGSAGNRQMGLESNKIKSIETKDEQGNFHVKHVSGDLSKKIKSLREAKGWTQKELANKAQVPLGIVRDYERGVAISNGNYTSKLFRVLN